MNTARKCALLFERVDDGGLRPGEWRLGDGVTSVSCPSCGCVQSVERPELLWYCRNEGCTVMLWLELLAAKG